MLYRFRERQGDWTAADAFIKAVLGASATQLHQQ
jgi:hypothetical protein